LLDDHAAVTQGRRLDMGGIAGREARDGRRLLSAGDELATDGVNAVS